MLHQLRYDYRQIFEDILKSVSDKETAELSGSPLIAVDECINKPVVREYIQNLCERGHACGIHYAWNQKRIRGDGSEVITMGGLPKRFRIEGIDVGKPKRGTGCDDQLVVAIVVSLLALSKNVVLLTENIKEDEYGLRRLLTVHIMPYLSSNHLNRFSLTTLCKRPETSLTDYCDQVVKIFEKQCFEFGYAEHLL